MDGLAILSSHQILTRAPLSLSVLLLWMGAQPNISCNIATFNDVFPEVVREPKPVEWRDGSQELANYCWVIVGVLLVYYLLTSKYVRGYGWAREDDARSKDE